MEFGVLGQLEAWREGERLALGPIKQRSLLALLVIHANQAVSTDQIIDELWGEGPAGDRHNALWIQVSKLRSTLEPGRIPRSDGTVLTTRSPGYVLQVEPDHVDAYRFELLVEEARACAPSDPASSSLLLGEGLALWRGGAYEEFAYESFAQAEIARLDELRIEAVELRLDADLRCGRAEELVAELQSLVHQHPLREHLSAQLMLALYRSDRQADALRAYGRLRRRLAEELGVDPSAALQRLEQQIICRDPALDVLAAPPNHLARRAVRGYELREQIGVSALGLTYRAYQPAVGRELSLTVVPPELANDATFIRRFQASADVANTLQHPNLVGVDDLWREPGGTYVVTRLIPGGSLESCLRHGPLTLDDAVAIVGDVASAVAAAHQRGYVHGGIENGTVLIEGHRGFLHGFGFVPSGTAAGPTMVEGCGQGFNAPEQLLGGPITPCTDVFRLGRVLERALLGDVASGSSPTVVIPGAVADLIGRATALRPDDRLQDGAAFAAALHDAVESTSESRLGAAMPAPVDNPYMGLQAFGEVDAANFFGRERVVERLVARLGINGSAGRFVAVVGPSGCGKSSVVRAGLLPALRRGAIAGSDDWFVVEITPNGRPFEELASGLSAIAVDPPVDLLDQLTDGRAGIRRVLRDMLPVDQSQLVLVIDQFEEVFTQGGVPAAQPFLAALAEAVFDRWSRLRLVITIRADFYDRPLSNYAFAELLRKGTELVAAMSPEELQRAIEGPADRVGVRFEPGVVARIVSDVADRPSALPLLQYALTELFDRRNRRVIELATYIELGGAAGALAQRADQVYDGLAPPEQETTRQLMLRLVNLGDSEDDVTRRRVLRRELLGIGGERTEVVLDTLAAHRLLTFDRDAVTRSPTVEISHEALFTEWSRLRVWIADCRDDLRQHRRLADAAQEWRAAAEAPDYLLSGGRLEELVALAARGAIRLTGPERAFLEASIDHRHAGQVAARDQWVRQTRLQRKSRRRAAVLIGSSAALIAVTTVAASQVAHSRATDRLADASTQAHRLAVASTSVATRQPDLAMLLALQSLSTSAHQHLPALAEAEDALHWAVQGAGLTYPTSDAPVDARRGPDGLTGVFRLSLPTLVEMAREHVTRGFTAAECHHYSLHPCPPSTTGLASPAGTGAAPVPSPPPPTPASALARPLAGTTVTLLDAGWGSTSLDAELEVFEADTGINVKLVRPSNSLEPTFDRLPDGTRPDVTLVYSPDVLRTLAEARRLVDLGAYLDRDAVRSEIGDELTTQATVGSGLYWLPLSFDVKGLVWYSPRAFREAGYQVPRTMDELVALTNQMAAAGRTPWCLANGRGPETGWPVTDWLEALVLRVGGTELYDRWTKHDVPFDHADVRRAGALLNEVLFGPGFLHGGPSWSNQRNPDDAVPSLLGRPPACWMFEGSSSTINVLAAGTARLGEDVDYFTLPPLRAGATAPAEGGGVAAAAMSDRPEVRELMRYFASATWGRLAASQSTLPFIPARTQLYVVDCVDHSASLAANGVRVRLCQDARAALRSGEWRFDASDQMPAVIGGLRADHTGGAFLQGMVDYVDHGPDSLDRVLTEIDGAWP